MQVFRELFIRGEPEQLAEATRAICASVSGDWSRDTDAEEHMRGVGLAKWRVARCFQCRKLGRRPAATVFLLEKDARTDYVANIVPHDAPELSHAEYNSLLEDFFVDFVEPAAVRTGVRAELTEPEAEIERWLAPDAAQKLRAFCAIANKHTGASHPADRKLWYEFVVSAHRSDSELTASTLARWLHETGGWDEEWADKLAIQYEQARGLLQFADRQPVGA